MAKKKEYTATAKVMGKIFTGKGETISDAIEAIEPGNVAGVVIMTVSRGKKAKERILPMVTAKRLFMTVGMTKEVALKNMSNIFDGI